MNNYFKVVEVDRDYAVPIGQGPNPRLVPFIVFHCVMTENPPSDDPYEIEDDAVDAVVNDTGLSGESETEWVDDRTVAVTLYKN